MIALKNTRIRLAALLILLTLWLETSHSQVPASSAFGEEITKQESIYQSKGEQVPEGYSIDRSLVDYTRALSSEFDPALANLGPKDRWLDIGASKGYAILDYYTPNYDLMHSQGRERRGKKAQAVAISIEDRRTPRWQQEAASLGENKIQYLFNRRIANAEGSEVRVCSWLKSITCVQVSCDFKASWKPPIEAFHIRKVCNDVTVPALVPIHYQAGTPPERRFQLRTPPPASPGRTSATR